MSSFFVRDSTPQLPFRGFMNRATAVLCAVTRSESGWLTFRMQTSGSRHGYFPFFAQLHSVRVGRHPGAIRSLILRPSTRAISRARSGLRLHFLR